MSTTVDNWFTPWMAAAEAASREMQSFWSKAAAAPNLPRIASEVRVGATPHTVSYRENKLRLLHYESDVRKQFRTPLVIVFALVNRPYILDLTPHKSVVRKFLDRGFDVYLVDWGVPTHSDRRQGLEEYIDGLMYRVVDHVCDRSRTDSLSILGYCMGGTMSAMYTALYPGTVRNLMLLAAPIDWSQRESLLSVWTDAKYFDVDAFIDAFGNAPPNWLQSSFLMLKPVSNFIEKYLTFYEKMDDEDFIKDFVAMETWLNDNIPVAGETFRQFVKYCFQENRLIQNRLPIGDRVVDLQKITCPILNLTATADHLVPCGQSLPFNDAVGSSDRQSINFPAGHIGLAVGSKAQRQLWPQAADWLAQRSESV